MESKELTFEEFMKKSEFEVTNKLIEIFQIVAEKDGFKANEIGTGADITEEIIENEISMEKIDVESLLFLIYKEWKRWYYR